MDRVDVGIITIREDEYLAVLDQFTQSPSRVRLKHEYEIRELRTRAGNVYRVAVVRCLGQGNLESKGVAEDLIHDLNPGWLLVVGIAGAAPTHDFGLGDVAVSSFVHDFTVEAVLANGDREFSISGGPLHRLAQMMAAALVSRERDAAGWNSPERVGSERPSEYYDPRMNKGKGKEWKSRIRSSIDSSFAIPRPPKVTTRRFAASDRLLKNIELLAMWQTIARHAEVIEMESAGVYHSSHKHQVPFLAIRGISDVIGYKRSPVWTAYACRTAAAFTRAYLETEPFQIHTEQQHTDTGIPLSTIRALEQLPYPIKISDEIDLYLRFLPDLAQSMAFRRAAEAIALFSVLTRINTPVLGDVSILHKALIYDGRAHPDTPEGTLRSVRAEQHGEGMSGFPPSFGFSVLLMQLNSTTAGLQLSPFATLNRLWGHLRNLQYPYTVLCKCTANILLEHVLTHFRALCRQDVIDVVTHPNTQDIAITSMFQHEAFKACQNVHLYEWQTSHALQSATSESPAAIQLETLLELSGVWSENEQRQFIFESAEAAIRGRFENAPCCDRLLRAIGDLNALTATDKQRESLASLAESSRCAELTTEARTKLFAPLDSLGVERREEILRTPFHSLFTLDSKELAVVVTFSRLLLWHTGKWNHEMAAYLNHVNVDATGQPFKSSSWQTITTPNREWLQLIEEGAGIPSNKAKDHRRHLVNLMAGMWIEGKSFDLKREMPAIAWRVFEDALENADRNLERYRTDFENHLWTRLCPKCPTRPPEHPEWAPRIVGYGISTETARRIGRAIAIGNTLDSLRPLLSAIFSQRMLDQIGFGAETVISRDETDRIAAYLITRVSRERNYSMEIASDIWNYAKHSRTHLELRLPFPLDSNGRYTPASSV